MKRETPTFYFYIHKKLGQKRFGCFVLEDSGMDVTPEQARMCDNHIRGKVLALLALN